MTNFLACHSSLWSLYPLSSMEVQHLNERSQFHGPYKHLRGMSNSPFGIRHSLTKLYHTTKFLTWDHMKLQQYCSYAREVKCLSPAGKNHLLLWAWGWKQGWPDPNFCLGQTSSLLWLTFLCNKELQKHLCLTVIFRGILSLKPLLAEINLCLYWYIIYFKMSYSKK